MCDKNPVCGTYSPVNDVWSICNSCRQKLIKGKEQCFYALLTLFNNNIECQDADADSQDLKEAIKAARQVIAKHGNIMPEQFKG